MRYVGSALYALALSVPLFAQPSVDPVIEGPAVPAAPAVIARDVEGRITVRAMRLPSTLAFNGRLDEAFYEQVPFPRTGPRLGHELPTPRGA
jgi:hypothetical protein